MIQDERVLGTGKMGTLRAPGIMPFQKNELRILSDSESFDFTLLRISPILTATQSVTVFVVGALKN